MVKTLNGHPTRLLSNSVILVSGSGTIACIESEVRGGGVSELRDRDRNGKREKEKREKRKEEKKERERERDYKQKETRKSTIISTAQNDDPISNYHSIPMYRK